ncbi:MAG: hypothetical protein ABJC13_09140 [Acidobacteriota bacterium]
MRLRMLQPAVNSSPNSHGATLAARVRKTLSATALFCTLGALLLAGAVGAQMGTGPFAAFPSQSTVDSRFLSFGCSGPETMEQATRISLAAPESNVSFELNVFDGDTARVDAESNRHWDLGSRQVKLSLYADPLRSGDTSPENLIGEWFGNDENATGGVLWTASAATMPDNDWWAVSITNATLAQAPSGNYFYNLVIQTDGDCASNEQLESNLKLAVSSPVTFQLSRFSLVGEICQSTDDGALVHPGSSAVTPQNADPVAVTYDGSFELFFPVAAAQAELRLFDGDFDFGTDALTASPSEVGLDACVDTDDPDTDSGYVDFPFLTPGALAEGAAGPGSPADDNSSDDLRRGEPGDPNGIGCVRYEVTDPESNVYSNPNPSGTQEWEQFLIAGSSSAYTASADQVYGGATLPGGIWTIKIVGLDMSNPVLWNASSVCSTRPAREALPAEDPNDVPRMAACPNVPTYLMGGFVWADDDGHGKMDPKEKGIAGVLVDLVRPSDGAVIASSRTGDTTNPNWESCLANFQAANVQGLACFGVDIAAEYEMRIAKANFAAGQPLSGKISTTGGETEMRSLTAGNSMYSSFGYQDADFGTVGPTCP